MECKKVKINYVVYEFKKCTPEDFLGKEGIPISQWQTEAEFIINKERQSAVTLGELKQTWKKLFLKSLISVNGKSDNLETIIDFLVDNMNVASRLYNEISDHSLGKKKNQLLAKMLA